MRKIHHRQDRRSHSTPGRDASSPDRSGREWAGARMATAAASSASEALRAVVAAHPPASVGRQQLEAMAWPDWEIADWDRAAENWVAAYRPGPACSAGRPWRERADWRASRDAMVSSRDATAASRDATGASRDGPKASGETGDDRPRLVWPWKDVPLPLPSGPSKDGRMPAAAAGA